MLQVIPYVEDRLKPCGGIAISTVVLMAIPCQCFDFSASSVLVSDDAVVSPVVGHSWSRAPKKIDKYCNGSGAGFILRTRRNGTPDAPALHDMEVQTSFIRYFSIQKTIG